MKALMMKRFKQCMGTLYPGDRPERDQLADMVIIYVCGWVDSFDGTLSVPRHPSDWKWMPLFAFRRKFVTTITTQSRGNGGERL